jgi:hypothetical protein
MGISEERMFSSVHVVNVQAMKSIIPFNIFGEGTSHLISIINFEMGGNVSPVIH